MNKRLFKISKNFKYKINITYLVTKCLKINKIILKMINNIKNKTTVSFSYLSSLLK